MVVGDDDVWVYVEFLKSEVVYLWWLLMIL